jgi:hypothetical protein
VDPANSKSDHSRLPLWINTTSALLRLRDAGLGSLVALGGRRRERTSYARRRSGIRPRRDADVNFGAGRSVCAQSTLKQGVPSEVPVSQRKRNPWSPRSRGQRAARELEPFLCRGLRPVPVSTTADGVARRELSTTRLRHIVSS